MRARTNHNLGLRFSTQAQFSRLWFKNVHAFYSCYTSDLVNELFILKNPSFTAYLIYKYNLQYITNLYKNSNKYEVYIILHILKFFVKFTFSTNIGAF